MEEKVKQKLSLLERKYLELEGVHQVDSFDEQEIVLETNMGTLFLKGEGLHIIKLNLDEGTVSIQGFLNSMEYREVKSARSRGKNILSRIMK